MKMYSRGIKVILHIRTQNCIVNILIYATFGHNTVGFFATKIIPQPNYLTMQMLGFLGLYKDQNIVFIICYITVLTAVLWS